MLRQRILVTIFLLPLGMAAIYFGGWYYFAIIALLLLLAAWEYCQLFRAGGYQPGGALIVGGVFAILLVRSLNLFGGAAWAQDVSWLIALLTLTSMSYHLIQFERGRDEAATDFAISIAGILYIGLLGSHLLLLRELPEGVWWVLLTLPAVWFADSGAYFYGRAYGRRKFSPRLSPKKTWEGYIAGIVVGVLGTAAFAALWQIPAGPETAITPLRGAILGLIISIITPLGDLGESMIKRQVGVKDSSNLIPGHGGAFDRIDSWLWAGVIGFYCIVWFFI